MSHFYGIIGKLIWTTIILVGIFTFIYNHSFWQILALSCLVVSFGFVIVDMYLLRVTNNLVALVCDFLLIMLLIVFTGTLTTGTGIPFSIAAICSVIIVAGEWPLHRYLMKHADEIPELQ